MKRLSTAERTEFVLAVKDMTVEDARKYAEENVDWKYKAGKQNLSPDERFADWFANQRQRVVCDLVKDHLIESGDFDSETAIDEARKASDASSEFYFLRDNLGKTELLEQADKMLPDIQSPKAQQKESLRSAFEKLGLSLK